MKCLLTFDYELFGSGKGSISKHVIEPTNKILDVLDAHGVKATFFVDQLELQEILKQGMLEVKGSLLYEEVRLLKEQVLQMIHAGHDVQLHLHPQWYCAQYKDREWLLNFNWWCFSNLPYRTQGDGTPGQLDLLIEGKAYLEALIKPIKADYECIAFRAGGYNIDTGGVSALALLEAGFKVDSSICPGFYANTGLSQYDFTNLSYYRPFYLEYEGESNKILELPLLTINSNTLSRLSLARLYSKIVNRKYKNIAYKTKSEGRIPSKPSNFKNTNFDLCLSSNKQVSDFYNLMFDNADSGLHVLIGHPKDYSIFSPVSKIIKKLSPFCITVSESLEGDAYVFE